MLRLLDILFLLFQLNHGNLTVLAHLTALRRVPKPTVTAAWNTSAASPSIQANGSSHMSPSAIESYNSSRGVINDAATLPVPFVNQQKYALADGKPMPLDPNKILTNYENVKSGFCAIGDDFCSFENSDGTVTEAIATNFSDQCLLWDISCSGNRTMAIERFFGLAFSDQYLVDRNKNLNIKDNDCFMQNGYSSDCDAYNPAERLADFKKIKNWMRSPQCVSAASEWITLTGHPWGYVFDGGMNESRAEFVADEVQGFNSSLLPSCCGTCDLWAQTVDLYYWPEPDANSSCTSIIGESVRPPDYGATTSIEGISTDIYWACKTLSVGPNDVDGESVTKTGDFTTAEITSFGSQAVKVSRLSPWSSSPCIKDDEGFQPSNQSGRILNEHASVYARGHSLIVPSSVTQDNGLSVSTMISGNFTL